MIFDPPLVSARFLRRYKRFFADMTLDDGTDVVAHCPNPGAMLGVLNEGARCWLSPSTNPKRKLAWTWELVEADGTLVGLNTGRPNALVAEAIQAGTINELTGYGDLRREVKYGKNSRIDILLGEPGRPDCYVEVKNVHLMREPGLAEFPDSVTARGAKHLGELADMAAAGHRALMCFLIQRSDCDRFALAGDIDPAYARAYAEATAAGVEAVGYGCDITAEAITVDRRLDIAS